MDSGLLKSSARTIPYNPSCEEETSLQSECCYSWSAETSVFALTGSSRSPNEGAP